MPEYPYDQNYDQFAFHSLLTRKESIEATGKVRTECNKVCIMSLFHIPTTKPMRLEEFEQTQSQASSQVSYMFFGINFIFICNLDFFPLISQSDIVNINELTLIQKVIGLCDIKHIMMSQMKIMMSVLKVNSIHYHLYYSSSYWTLQYNRQNCLNCICMMRTHKMLSVK